MPPVTAQVMMTLPICPSPGSAVLFRPMPAMSCVQNGDSPGPAGRAALHLHRQAGDGESRRRQRFQIVQLLDLAVARLPAGLVAFPDQRGVAGLGEAARGMAERSIPAPAIGADDAD